MSTDCVRWKVRLNQVCWLRSCAQYLKVIILVENCVIENSSTFHLVTFSEIHRVLVSAPACLAPLLIHQPSSFGFRQPARPSELSYPKPAFNCSEAGSDAMMLWHRMGVKETCEICSVYRHCLWTLGSVFICLCFNGTVLVCLCSTFIRVEGDVWLGYVMLLKRGMHKANAARRSTPVFYFTTRYTKKKVQKWTAPGLRGASTEAVCMHSKLQLECGLM